MYHKNTKRGHLLCRVAQGPLLAMGLLASAQIMSANAQSNQWLVDFQDYNTASGDRFTDSTDAALLAWQEGYLLRAFINMYELSGDTTWLTEFTDHFDVVMATASDVDGDGYEEWTSARYSPILVANSTFESGDSGDATLPASWIRNGSTSSTAFRTDQPGEFIEGNACSTATWGVELVTSGGTAQRMYQVLSSYEPNQPYQLTFSGKNGGSVDGRVFVYDRTDNALLASVRVDSSDWKSFSADFTTPAAGHTVEVWLAHYDTTPDNQSVFFDNVRVRAYYAYHVLDGMIATPVAEFVKLVDDNSTALASYQTDADTYQTFLEDEVFPKWEDASSFYGNTWDSVAGFYVEPLTKDTFSTGTLLDPLPYNQCFALVGAMRTLYEVNGDTTYLDKAKDCADYFRANLGTSGAAYTWDYAAFSGSKIEDTSHANVDMEFITQMYHYGDTFTPSDMDKFAATLTDLMWVPASPPTTTVDQLFNFVTGVNGTYCEEYRFSDTMWGWVPLAEFDSRAWDIAASQYDNDGVNLGHLQAHTLTEIMRWDPQKLVNQSFEYVDTVDSTLPARWTRFLSSASTAFLDSVNKSSGEYGFTIKSNGTSWQKLEQPWEDYDTLEDYTVTFEGKVDGSGADGRVWIYNKTFSTTEASYNFDNTTWQTHSFTFTAPSTQDELVIQLGHQDYTVVDGETHFDDISIKVDGDPW